MFAAQRQSHLRNVHWKPEQPGGLYFIETRDEEPAQLRHGGLVGAEIHDWVRANVSPYARTMCLSKLTY